MNQLNNHVIISGSSITNDSAWPTWATWAKLLYGWNNVTDLSQKGLGNKVIILNALKAAAESEEPPMIILQLTSVDKWDWYIENQNVIAELSEEKHPVILLDPLDKCGFWSTGSHFPLGKDYYKENYLSLQYHAFETAMMLQWFQLVCQHKKWRYRVLLESPVMSVTESQLNTGRLSAQDCHATTLMQNSLCNIVDLDLDNIYLPGLIGYACLNDLPWFHDLYKAHPGSLVHFYFTRDILAPQLDVFFSRQCDINSLQMQAEKFQELLN